MAHIRPRTLLLLGLGLLVVAYFSVVAARTDVLAIVDTGDASPPVAIATLALLDAGGGAVSARGGDNYAVALNTEDGTSVAESAFLITYAASGVVDQSNAAVAYAKCESCRAFAFAIEVVLVPEDKANNIAPTNEAVAVNEECTTCTTAAFATQFVLGVDGPVGFTEEGNEEIEEIMEDLEELEEDAEEENLSLEEIEARYDEIVARLEEVLANELVPVGGGGDDDDDDDERTLESTGGPESTGPETTGGSPESTAPSTMQAPETTVSPEQTLPEETVPGATVPQDPSLAGESQAPAGTTTPVPGAGEATTSP